MVHPREVAVVADGGGMADTAVTLVVGTAVGAAIAGTPRLPVVAGAAVTEAAASTDTASVRVSLALLGMARVPEAEAEIASVVAQLESNATVLATTR